MKLYELPRGAWFSIDDGEECAVLKLEKIDGAYSRCHDKYGQLYHITASASVEEVSFHEPE
jgi:hypothetical protein